MKSVRGIQSIKVFNSESEREKQWLNRYSDVRLCECSIGRARVTFKTLNDLIFGFENIAVIYLAAGLALDNILTIGMIFAFMAYKLQFVENQFSSWRRASTSVSLIFILSDLPTLRSALLSEAKSDL